MRLVLTLQRSGPGVVANYNLEPDGGVWVGSVPTWDERRFSSVSKALAWARELAELVGVPKERIFVETDEVQT